MFGNLSELGVLSESKLTRMQRTRRSESVEKNNRRAVQRYLLAVETTLLRQHSTRLRTGMFESFRERRRFSSLMCVWNALWINNYCSRSWRLGWGWLFKGNCDGRSQCLPTISPQKAWILPPLLETSRPAQKKRMVQDGKNWWGQLPKTFTFMEELYQKRHSFDRSVFRGA